jgi:hypothetical protein
MAKHDVRLTLPVFEIGKMDLVIDIKSNDSKLGTLTISKGSIEYYPASKQTPISLTWEKFDELMATYNFE